MGHQAKNYSDLGKGEMSLEDEKRASERPE